MEESYDAEDHLDMVVDHMDAGSYGVRALLQSETHSWSENLCRPMLFPYKESLLCSRNVF